MSQFYDDMKAVADELIGEFGQPITMTLKGKAAGGRDPVTGEPTPAEPDVIISGDGIKLQYKKVEVDGVSVIAGDCKLKFVYNDGVLVNDFWPFCFQPYGVLKIGMITTIDGENWRVMQPNPVTPSGTNLLYDVQLRRG